MFKEKEIKIKNRYQITTMGETFIFERQSYREEYLKDLISCEDYIKIIDEINGILLFCNDIKKKNDLIALPKWIKILTIFTWLLAFIYIVLISYVASTPKENKNLLSYAIGIINFCIFVCFVLILMNYLRKISDFMPLLNIVEKELTKYFKKIHEKYENKFEFEYIINKNVIDIKIFEIEKENLNENNKSDSDSSSYSSSSEEENNEEENNDNDNDNYNDNNNNNKDNDKSKKNFKKKPTIPMGTNNKFQRNQSNHEKSQLNTKNDNKNINMKTNISGLKEEEKSNNKMTINDKKNNNKKKKISFK
jgi:hypothetical protein